MFVSNKYLTAPYSNTASISSISIKPPFLRHSRIASPARDIFFPVSGSITHLGSFGTFFTSIVRMTILLFFNLRFIVLSINDYTTKIDAPDTCVGRYARAPHIINRAPPGLIINHCPLQAFEERGGVGGGALLLLGAVGEVDHGLVRVVAHPTRARTETR